MKRVQRPAPGGQAQSVSPQQIRDAKVQLEGAFQLAPRIHKTEISGGAQQVLDDTVEKLWPKTPGGRELITVLAAARRDELSRGGD